MLQVLIDTPTVYCASYGDLFVVRWKRRATRSEFEAVVSAKVDLRRQLGDGRFAIFTWVDAPAVVKPDAEIQRAIDMQERTTRGWIKAEAMAIVADGFAASLMRSVITGVALLNPVDHPYKVFGEVPPACEWIAPHIVGPGSTRPTASTVRRLMDG